MADIVEGFRKVVQDLLVPELKAVQVELKYLKEAQQETNKKVAAMQSDIQNLILGQKEILAKLDLDKRITKLETIVEQILKKVA